MTREEARQIITTWLVSSKGTKGQCGYIEGWFDEEDVEAFRMAIEALKQVTGKLNKRDDSLLTDDTETCKEHKSKLDLISRADAIAYLTEHMNWYSEDGYEADEEEKEDVITDLVNGIPSADRPTQLKDGTLMIAVEDVDAIKRVIVENHPWCKVFYGGDKE